MEGQQRRIVGGVDIRKDRRVAAVVDDQDRVFGTGSFATTRQGQLVTRTVARIRLTGKMTYDHFVCPPPVSP